VSLILISMKDNIISNTSNRSDVPQEIFSVRFSSDGTLLATGCNDGKVRVYSGKTGGSVLQTLCPSPEDDGPPQGSEELSVQLPITAMRFRPGGNSRGVLLTCSADASVRHWHVPTGKCLSTIYEGGDQQVFACDYRLDGQVFATGGKDKCVRLYDESKLSLSSGLGSSAATSNRRAPPSSAPRGTVPIATFGGNLHAGTSIESLASNSISNDHSYGAGGCHSNRIFAVCFHPHETDIILSGGWDNTIQIWDARVSGAGRGAVRSMFGAHLCGDALQVTPDGNYVISGSWRLDDALQVWDYRSGGLVSSIPFLRSNSEVKTYLKTVSKVRNSNGVVNSSVGEPPRSPPPPINRFSFPSAPLRSVNPVMYPPSVPAYEKPDPTLLYSISFSKTSSVLNGVGRSPGYYVFAGGSGINGGKVFQTKDLLSFAYDISSTKVGSSSIAITKEKDEERPPKVMESLAGAKESVPLQARTCRPLIASISGLSRGVFASDWDGHNGLVVVGGDQPIRVFDVNTSGESSSKNISVGKGGGGEKWRVGGRVGIAIDTHTAESLKNEDEIFNKTHLTEFVSGDSTTPFFESALPSSAPVNFLGLRPPPAVLLALAASKTTPSDDEVTSIESSEKDVKASKSISVDTVAQEPEVKDALSSNTSSAWEEENMILHDTNAGAMSNDAEVDEGEGNSTFDAGFRKKTNPSVSVTRAHINPQSSHSGEALEVRIRRSSALRALIEGSREKEFEKEA
jgi:WD40 repeat protein